MSSSIIIENTEILDSSSIPIFNASEISSVPIQPEVSNPTNGDKLIYDSASSSWVTGPVYSITGPTGPTGPSDVVNNTSQLISFSDTSFTNVRNSYMVSILKNSNISDENLTTFCRTTNSTLSKMSYTFGVNEQNTRWVSVGESYTGSNSSIAYSIDGVSWTNLSNSTGILSSGNSLDWDGNVWVACGTPGTTTNSSIVFSRNGLDWQSATGSVDIFNYEVRSVKTDGDRWIAVGSTGAVNNICYSDDGIVWKPCVIEIFPSYQYLQIEPYSIGYNGTYWVIVGERLYTSFNTGLQVLYISKNGIIFDNYPIIMSQLDSTTDPPIRINTVCWNGNFWVYGTSSETIIGGTGGAVVWNSDPGLFPYSSNISSNLTPVSSDQGSNLEIKNISWNGKFFIASGTHTSSSDSSKYMYSYNGVNWSLDVSSVKIFGKLLNTFWDGTKWLGVGVAGPGNTTQGGINTTGYSYNGIDWYGVESSPASPTFPIITFTSLLFNRCNSVRRNTEYKNKLLFTPKQVFLLDNRNTTGYGSLVGNGKLTGSTTDASVVNWNWTDMAANDACWNGNNWVIVCDSNINFNNGTIYYSIAPISVRPGFGPTDLWNNIGASIFSISGNGITWDGTKWIALGEGTNTIAYSYDGNTWIPVTNNNLLFTSGKKVYFNKSLYVAVGTGNYSIIYSYDGINWTGVNSSNSIFSTAHNVIYNGYIWIAVGEGTNTIAYSNDGINWTGLGKTIFTSKCFDLDYSNDTLLAVGEGTNTIAYSNDGISWIGQGSSTFTTRGNSIKWTEDKWIALGDNGTTKVLYFSSDGKTWINQLSSYPFFNDKSYIAKTEPSVGYLVFPQPCLALGYLYNGNTISYSNDGIFWNAVGTKIFNSAYNATWNGKMWIAVGSGDNTLAYSYNGVDWNGLGNSLFSEGRCVGWNGSMWVAGGAGVNPVHTIAYSYDGLVWYGLGKDIFSEGGYSITWTGKSWIMVGTGEYQIAKSFNGITWTPISSNTPFDGGYSRGVCTGNGIVVAVGTGQTNVQIAYSLDDGNTWNASLTPNVFGNYGYSVSWNGKIFVAVGGETKNIAYSYDGISWTAVSTNFFGTGSGASGNGVAWNGDRWIVVGSNINGNPIIYSQDGINWFKSQVNPNLMTIGYGVGVNSKIGAAYVPNKKYLSAGQQLVFNSPSYYDSGITAPTDITILLSES
jgi:hypothetical protein